MDAAVTTTHLQINHADLFLPPIAPASLPSVALAAAFLEPVASLWLHRHGRAAIHVQHSP